jgi:hypothetical protein
MPHLRWGHFDAPIRWGGPNEEQNSYESLKDLIINCSFLIVDSRVLVQPLHRQNLEWAISSSLSACFHSKHEYNCRLSATFFTSSCFSSFCNTFSAKSYSIAPIFFLFSPRYVTTSVTSPACGRSHPFCGLYLAAIILILSFPYAPYMLTA